ncbi:MAG: nucleotide exchange factor GrpE [Ruminiclostridium sp.]|nr:nucleotide exchange factor GrpE [Ruminiclostridium sp.]
MRGKKECQDAKEDKLNMDGNVTDNGTAIETSDNCENGAADDLAVKELEKLKAELEEKNKKVEEYLDKFQRSVAEFDNFKKRTIREKDSLYSEAVSDVISAILPVMDSLERALKACSGDNGLQSLKEGVDLVYRQMKDSLKNIGVEEINCCEACFDPQMHNAVLHVEDEKCGQNTVVEELQKGYVYKDKVIRHSMVKVAN